MEARAFSPTAKQTHRARRLEGSHPRPPARLIDDADPNRGGKEKAGDDGGRQRRRRGLVRHARPTLPTPVTTIRSWTTPWEAFWERTVRDNEQAVRDAGGDPAKVPGPQNLPTGRHGDVLKNGAPADHGKIRCWGCDARTTAQLECAQCLEIMKERASRPDRGASVLRSHLCYKEHYHEHKARHGPSESVPTKTDGSIHHFPCAEFLSLWDSKARPDRHGSNVRTSQADLERPRHVVMTSTRFPRPKFLLYYTFK